VERNGRTAKETNADKRGYPRMGADGKGMGGARSAPLLFGVRRACVRLRHPTYPPYNARFPLLGKNAGR
jgi:hypothetical protein